MLSTPNGLNYLMSICILQNDLFRVKLPLQYYVIGLWTSNIPCLGIMPLCVMYAFNVHTLYTMLYTVYNSYRRTCTFLCVEKNVPNEDHCLPFGYNRCEIIQSAVRSQANFLYFRDNGDVSAFLQRPRRCYQPSWRSITII